MKSTTIRQSKCHSTCSKKLLSNHSLLSISNFVYSCIFVSNIFFLFEGLIGTFSKYKSEHYKMIGPTQTNRIRYGVHGPTRESTRAGAQLMQFISGPIVRASRAHVPILFV